MGQNRLPWNTAIFDAHPTENQKHRTEFLPIMTYRSYQGGLKTKQLRSVPRYGQRFRTLSLLQLIRQKWCHLQARRRTSTSFYTTEWTTQRPAYVCAKNRNVRALKNASYALLFTLSLSIISRPWCTNAQILTEAILLPLTAGHRSNGSCDLLVTGTEPDLYYYYYYMISVKA